MGRNDTTRTQYVIYTKIWLLMCNRVKINKLMLNKCNTSSLYVYNKNKKKHSF